MDEKNGVLYLRDEDLTEATKTLVSSLPFGEDSSIGKKICKYQGCWYTHDTLQGVLNFQRHFKPQDTDIIVSSFPKCGTTWLKALTFTLVHRSKHSFNDHDHPLLSYNPHVLVPYLELNLYLYSETPDLSTKFSSRLFASHTPFCTLREGLKETPCKIVYVCRDVKDTLVSYWHFFCGQKKDIEAKRSSLEDMFESFCSGVMFYGPFWDHVLSYWRGSLDDPKHVLFMRYEEMKAEPREQIKKLADFLGYPFSEEEEKGGSVDEILNLCSLRHLSSFEVNKTGKLYNGRDNNTFFRKGEVGDWKNHLTPEMETKIDMIIEEKLQGSGLKF